MSCSQEPLIGSEISNPYTIYNGHHRVDGKLHQHSGVVILADTGSKSQKYLRIQSNVPVVLLGL